MYEGHDPSEAGGGHRLPRSKEISFCSHPLPPGCWPHPPTRTFAHAAPKVLLLKLFEKTEHSAGLASTIGQPFFYVYFKFPFYTMRMLIRWRRRFMSFIRSL